jgi:3-oxoacyl-[acyl-carrier protein] reductase
MIYEDLKGKKVLVTGASSGIGVATAIMFAQQGAFIGVHYFKTKDGAEKTLAEVKKHSDGILLKADMRDELQVNQMINDFTKKAGGIDILINNAGTLLGRTPLETATLEFYEDVFATNTRSVFLATRAAMPHLKKSKGNIVNIGSVAGHHGGGAGSGIYAAAKAAVATMTIAMAKEFAAHHIRVNSVLPGFIDTRFHQQFSDEARRKAIAEETPLGRNGSAEDVAKAYIAVNGGLYMRA